ncbi:hypothetical protein BJ138DRAFT_258928 [Hygrophoropsis aurantiaca]|uniref:Uncharacterized protein n=1 Tax=Hygrophoropsis aurantiaca TaxID=72124 RepID=A0ACB8A862_9AGAM|nr:hypothetical protein BJ138DRAFT_258928 [Hygrophoropsis aurantiaca]
MITKLTTAHSHHNVCSLPVIFTMTDENQSDEAVAPVDTPFDAPDADIILRSSDGADIRTYKLILSLVSPVFRSMLTLPQPADETATSSTPPIIIMQEDKHTLEKLLLHCYPGYYNGISLDSLDDIKVVVAAATKYDMQAVLEHIRKWMVTSPLFATNPWVFYAMSCLQGWEAEARLAAFNIIKGQDLYWGSDHYVPELEGLNAGSYYRLTTYHARCGAAARDSTRNLECLGTLLSRSCMDRCYQSNCLKVRLRFGTHDFPNVPSWFQDYLHAVGEELVLRPSVSTVMDSKLLTKALKEAGSCPTCCSRLSVLPELRDLFVSNVAEAVSKVELEFAPPPPKTTSE